MVQTTIQEQIIREAPEIEAIKLGLLQDAKGLAGIPLTLPTQQVAGLSGLQQQAFLGAEQEGGIGGYQPFLGTGQATLGTGLGTMGTGLGTMGTGLGTLGTGLGTLGTAFAPVSQAQAAAQRMQGLFSPSPGPSQGPPSVAPYPGPPRAIRYGTPQPDTAAVPKQPGSEMWPPSFFPPQPFGTDLSAYTNPFQQAVIDETMAELNRQGEIQQNQLGANAVRAGAFGGSRFGVQEAELGRNLQDVRARALAQLNQQNYMQALQSAQQAFEAQQTRTGQASQLLSGIGQLTGQLGTQQAAIGGQQAGIGAQQAGIGGQQAGIGGQQLALAELAQQTGLKDIEMQQRLGSQQQAQQQAILSAQQANAQRQLLEPYSRVAFLSDIYKGAPSTQTSLGSQIAPSPQQPSTFQQIAGLGTGLLGTAAAAKQLGGIF